MVRKAHRGYIGTWKLQKFRVLGGFIQGFYRGNGRENGNYWYKIVVILFFCMDSGKENGNYYVGFWDLGFIKGRFNKRIYIGMISSGFGENDVQHNGRWMHQCRIKSRIRSALICEPSTSMSLRQPTILACQVP